MQRHNSIIGKPEEAKYGLTKEQMIHAYKICKAEGVKHFGIHTMVASNELNPDFFESYFYAFLLPYILAKI